MKQIIVAAAMLFASSVAMAQYADTDNYTRLQASFVTNKLSNAGDPGIEPKGFALGITQGYSVSDQLPIFLEIGANLQWSHSAKDLISAPGKTVDYKFTYMNVAIPVNGVYKYTLNDKVAFSGYAGLNFKVNFMGLQKSNEAIFFDADKNEFSKKLNLLSKDAMGGRDYRANIFQLGGQIGLGVHLSDIYIGWQYQNDFMKFLETNDDDKQRWHTNYITVGYTVDLFNL